jgi:hypothetical protein
MTIGDHIIEVASEFEGLVEIISNSEWDDKKTKGKDPHAIKFESMLKRAGHVDGWPYCMSFCEGAWMAAYEDTKAGNGLLDRIASLLCPHVMTSFHNCKRAGLITQDPVRGAVMFMQSGGSSSGHAGIVTGVDGGWFRTIEANTSSVDQNERDGAAGTGGVFRKKRLLTFAPKTRGLWLRGFLNPIQP